MNRTVKWLYAVAVCLLTLLPGSLQAQCGGTERWQVKVGTDTGVGTVDLTNPISISVQDLIQLPEPQRPPQTRRSQTSCTSPSGQSSSMSPTCSTNSVCDAAPT